VKAQVERTTYQVSEEPRGRVVAGAVGTELRTL
jgi:hypothetical protein